MTKTISQPPQTRVARLAAFFRARPNRWIDGRDIARIAGAYAWRTRVSDLRRPPFEMPIKNRQRQAREDDRAVVISEYAYVPDDHAALALEPHWELVP